MTLRIDRRWLWPRNLDKTCLSAEVDLVFRIHRRWFWLRDLHVCNDGTQLDLLSRLIILSRSKLDSVRQANLLSDSEYNSLRTGSLAGKSWAPRPDHAFYLLTLELLHHNLLVCQSLEFLLTIMSTDPDLGTQTLSDSLTTWKSATYVSSEIPDVLNAVEAVEESCERECLLLKEMGCSVAFNGLVCTAVRCVNDRQCFILIST